MSLHFDKPTYECLRCKAPFLPYKKGIKCPKCNMLVEDADTEAYIDAIDSITFSMKMHKDLHGTYFPGAWFTNNFMDHVQSLIYQIFDSMEKEKPANEEQYLADLLSNEKTWGDEQYLSKHIKDIASEVFKIYKSENFSEIKTKVRPKRPITRSEKIRKFFRKFLP